MRGTVFIDYLENVKTVNGEYYVILLQRIIEEVKQKRWYLAKKKELFQQDNAPADKSVFAMTKINELKFQFELSSPSDYFYSPNLKK